MRFCLPPKTASVPGPLSGRRPAGFRCRHADAAAGGRPHSPFAAMDQQCPCRPPLPRRRPAVPDWRPETNEGCCSTGRWPAGSPCPDCAEWQCPHRRRRRSTA
ncbi:hypothetical protein G6F50_017731 [Rhizopus delemar]|uniref:Uncharacterized protein n=1 Tax=Rhizopus delemar TaxID=936053 RepID=A0A9P7BZT2_9FUNG|nr:hypothetical protein G6F50_017731 [Rhizopus delemar]